MKVFVIRNAWVERDFGGAEDYAVTLVEILRKQSVDATLISGTRAILERAKSLPIPCIKGPYSSHQILTKHRFVFLPKYLLDLYTGYRAYLKLFKDTRPDIVHANGQQDGISATAAAKKLGIPVIWTDHGELKNGKVGILPPWGIPSLLLKYYARFTKIVCVSNSKEISLLSGRLKNTRFTVVPNGVLDTKDNARNAEFDLVFASRIIREKGIFELLEAYSELIKTRPSTTLLISGTGPSDAQVKDYIKQHALGLVTFEPFREDAIQRGRIFVLPSYTEAQSLAILKAMMHEKPIVTTNIEGNTHFLINGENALLVEPRSSSDLLETLRKLLEDPNKQSTLARAARTYYEQTGNFETIVSKYYQKIYAEILADAARADSVKAP